MHDYNEYSNIYKLTRTKLKFKSDIVQMSRETELNLVSIDGLNLKPSEINSKYSQDNKSILTSILNKALNDKSFIQERILLVCK